MDFWGFLLLGLLVAGGTVLGVALLLKKERGEAPKEEESRETPFLLIQQQLDGLRGDFLNLMEKGRLGMDGRLEGMHGRLDSAAKVFTGLEGRMVKIEEATRQVLEVGKDISSLQQILKSPKLRGNFGEQLLSDLLAQMMPQENYALQYMFRSGERVDAVVKTAQGLVPVDSKFPLENFRRFVDAPNEEEKKGARRQFLIDVKKHIHEIADKYILPSEGTFEFALMYIPAENVYYEIITRDLTGGENTSIAHHSLKKKVIPVSPNTFYAYLQTILLGLRGMQVEKRVQEIITELARLRKEVTGFRGDFSLIGTHLGRSQNSYEKADKRLNRLEDKLGALDVAAPEREALPPAVA